MDASQPTVFVMRSVIRFLSALLLLVVAAAIPLASASAATPPSPVWLPADRSTIGAGARLDQVVPWGTDFLIAGSEHGRITIWRSTDGVAWHKSSIPGKDGQWSRRGLRSQAQVGVGVVHGRIVVVTTLWGLRTDRIAVWTSRTGEHWQRVPDAPVFAIGADRRVGDVVSTGDQIVVSVAALRADVGAITSETSDLWQTVDGRHWERVHRDTGRRIAPDSIEAGAGEVLSVHQGEPGTSGEAVGLVTSPGLRWRTLGYLPGFVVSLLRGGSDGYIATAEIAEDGPLQAIWWSEDGPTWTQTLDSSHGPVSVADPPARRRIYDVAVSGSDAVAVGGWYAEESTIPVRPWAATSSDAGRTWSVASRQPALWSGSMYRAAIASHTVVAIGWDAAGNAATWRLGLSE